MEGQGQESQGDGSLRWSNRKAFGPSHRQLRQLASLPLRVLANLLAGLWLPTKQLLLLIPGDTEDKSASPVEPRSTFKVG